MSDLQTERLEPTARVPENQPQPARPENRRQRRPAGSPPAQQSNPQEPGEEPSHQLDRMA